MNAGVLLFVVTDVTNYLTAKKLLEADGSLNVPSIQEDVEIVGVVERSLRNHGVTVPAEIDKVLAVLPLVLSFAGVK